MREPGIPKLLGWRWAPCAALVLGALSFCGFMLLAIPEHIGGAQPTKSPALLLANQLSRTQSTTPSAPDWSSSTPAEGSALGSTVASPAAHVASRAGEAFPKRGFTPPLDRPEAAAAPAGVAMGTPPPPPAAPPPEPGASLVTPPQPTPPPAEPAPLTAQGTDPGH